MPTADLLFDDPSLPIATLALSTGDVLVEAGSAPVSLSRVVSGGFEAIVHDEGKALRTGSLGPGDVVGEISLFAGGRATATVRATEPSVVATIPSDAARAWLDRHPEVGETLAAEGRDRIDRNQMALLLADLLGTDDATVVADALGLCETVRLAAGGVLFEEGDVADAAYLVVTGRLGVHGLDADGERVELRRLGRGQIIGETGLFERRPRSATVTAIRDTVTVRIGAPAFEELLTRHPALMIRVGRQVLTRMIRPHAERRSTAVLAVAVTAPNGSLDLVRSVAESLLDHGSVTVVTPDVVDAELGRAGAFAADAGDVGSPRLTQYLHEVEIRHDVMVVGVRPADPVPWIRRGLSLADRILVVVSPDPDRGEWEAISRITSSAPADTTLIAVVLHPAGTERPHGSADLLARIGADDILHMRVGSIAEVGRVARLATGRGVGLVLGGGGARGFAHLGVYRALVELGVPIDTVAAASIGAALGGGISIGIGPDQAVASAAESFPGVLDYTIPVVSLIKAERLTREIDRVYGGWDFEDVWVPFRCVSTNLTTSRVHLHDRGPLPHAIRASLAIPGVMPPVPSGDDLLVDGGVLDNLPVDVVATEGRCATIIAVDVAPPAGPAAREDYGLSVSGWQALKANLGKGRSAYPKLTAVLMRSMIVGSMRHRDDLVAESGVDLVLQPDMRGVGLLDFDSVVPVADRGYELSKPTIEAWLTERGGWQR